MKRFGYLHSESSLPSMFVRRLTILLTVAVASAAVLTVQAYRLTVLEGDRWLEIADSRLSTESFTPTTRGRILDRKGRVLAEDRPAFDVLVDYEVITGQWAERVAEREARRAAGDRWARLSPVARGRLISELAEATRAEMERVWDELAAAIGEPREELDRQRDEIKGRVQRMSGHLWSIWLEERQQAVVDAGRAAGDVSLSDVATPIREQTTPHVVAAGITESQAASVRRLSERFPGVHLDTGMRRAYPLEVMEVEVDRSTFPTLLQPGEGEEVVARVRVEGVMPHVVGRMRALNRVPEGAALDTERRPLRDAATGEIDLGHYQSGDLVGGSGIEGSREDLLRGYRGRVAERLDTGETDVTPHVAGRDVRLTIDAALQARIHAVLDPSFGFTVKQPWHKSQAARGVLNDEGEWVLEAVPEGTALAASVVVLDISTGEVLSMVSHPSYTRGELRERGEEIFGDPLYAPWLNRAVSRPYAPGSIVKPLILCAAVAEGVYDLETVIETGGYLFPDKPNLFRDWIYKDYGITFLDRFGRGLYADEAIGVSSNVFFYTLGMWLGTERITDWYERFGVGEAFGLGVGFEYPGSALEVDRRAFQADAILMGIGQGPVDWTPMHAADAYATLARSGLRMRPRLDRDERPVAEDLNLDPAAVDAAMAGLRYSIEHEWGTGHAIPYPEVGRERTVDVAGVTVLGKTGTAEASALVHDPDGADGPEPRRVIRDNADHAWFVGLVSPEGQPPRYSVAVLVEYAGSGGRVSGPIAEQVILALKAEGYL